MGRRLKKIIPLLILCLVFAGVGISLYRHTVEAAAVTPTSGNIYYIKNKNSGMYLTVENDQATNGANVIQSKGTGSLGQRWILEQNSNGSYRLHPATDMTGNISLDVANGDASLGTNIQIWSNNGCSAQNFGIVKSGDGYAITTAVTNNASCLDVLNFATNSGANVIQWTNNQTANQIWYFEQAQWPSSGSSSSNNSSDSGEKVSIDNGYSMQRIQFMSANNEQYITSADGTGNVSYNSESQKLSQWILVNNGSNKYMIG